MPGVADEIEVREFHFRGGPLDGRWLRQPVDQEETVIPTVDGVWLGDRDEPLPQDLSAVDYRNERYVLIDGEYVHDPPACAPS